MVYFPDIMYFQMIHIMFFFNPSPISSIKFGKFHTPIPGLSIGTICPEDLLTQQTGIITSQYQYFHLNVLPNSEFSYCF